MNGTGARRDGRRPVIVDTDAGIDDAMAIALAVRHPSVELVGVTAVFGNTSLEYAARNVRYVLDVAGAPGVPVVAGAAAPLIRPPRPPAVRVHGPDGLGGEYPPGYLAARPHREIGRDPEDAASFIIRRARRAPGAVSLVGIGPLTNLATALAREPDLPSLLGEVIVMGGTLDGPGNVSPMAEANFLADPHAADRVLSAFRRLSVVGLDVTRQVVLSGADLRTLRDRGGAIGKLLWRATRRYADVDDGASHRKVGATPARTLARGRAMHDAVAMSRLTEPASFSHAFGAARVVHRGIASGMLLVDRVDFDYETDYWSGRPAIAVCTDIEAEAVRRAFVTSLTAPWRYPRDGR